MHSMFLNLTSTKSSPGSLIQAATDSDVVKRGCLYVKRPPTSNPVKLRFKAWQKRHLVLRDMLTQDGDALLELHSSRTAANTSADRGWEGTTSDRRHCSINLRTVVHVDVYRDSKTFPHAFIAYRAGTVPVIFGAKTDLEMREWMVVVKLMADKVVRLTTRDGNVLTTSTRQTTVDPRQRRLPLRSTLSKDEFIHRSTPTMLDSGSGGSCCRTSAKMPRHSSASPDAENIQGQTPSESNSKFLVKIQKTEDATLNGRYRMIVTASEICLKRPGAAAAAAADDDDDDDDDDKEEARIFWPLQYIMKLKSEPQADGRGDLITLVASSRCGRSGGTYTFRTADGMSLVRRVRMSAIALDANASSCRRQQRDIAMLKRIASSSFDRLSPSSPGVASVRQSLQSLLESSGGGRLTQREDSCESTSSGNSIILIAENASSNQLTSSHRSTALSRGSLAILSARTRLTDSGFESSDETSSLNDTPPPPPPRPVHTIA